MCMVPMGLWRLTAMSHFIELGFSKAAVEAAMLAYPEKWTEDRLAQWAKEMYSVARKGEGDEQG